MPGPVEGTDVEGGAFLSDDDFEELIDKEKVICTVEEENGEESLEPIDLEDSDGEEGWSDWNVDLSLGKEVFLSSDDEIRQLEENESVSIDPGEFALLITEEIVNIPNDKAAFISLKFKHARKGLINISGFHVDPNYTGKLVFSVYNASPSPKMLRQGQPIYMIVFANLTRAVEGNRDGANYEEGVELNSSMVDGLQGRTASLESLDDQVHKIDNKVSFHRSVLAGIVVTLVGSLIAGFFALIIALFSLFSILGQPPG